MTWCALSTRSDINHQYTRQKRQRDRRRNKRRIPIVHMDSGKIAVRMAQQRLKNDHKYGETIAEAAGGSLRFPKDQEQAVRANSGSYHRVIAF